MVDLLASMVSISIFIIRLIGQTFENAALFYVSGGCKPHSKRFFSAAGALLETTPYWHHTCLGGNVKCVFFGSGGVKIRELAGKVFSGTGQVGFGLELGWIQVGFRRDLGYSKGRLSH